MNIVQKTRAIFRKQEHCSEGRREDDLMSVELILATSSITLALVFYTIGVFKERKAGILRLNHVLFFWIGLVFDVTGTAIMTFMAQSSDAAAAAGDFGIHGLTGLLAIVLMLIHASWATITYLHHNKHGQEVFHKFSTFVWLVWLIPYIIGMLIGIPMIHLQSTTAIVISIVLVGIVAFLVLTSSDTKKGSSK